MVRTKTIKNIYQILLSNSNSDEWKDWLNHLQALLIEMGHCESLTRAGSAEFASKFLSLQEFFSAIKMLSQQKS